MDQPIVYEVKRPAKKNKWRVVILVLIVLIALGAGGWYWYSGGKESKTGKIPPFAAPQISRDELIKNLPSGFPIPDSSKILFSSLTSEISYTVYSAQFQTSSGPQENLALYQKFFEDEGWKVTLEQNNTFSYIKFYASKGEEKSMERETVSFESFISPLTFENGVVSGIPEEGIINPETLVSLKYYKR